MILNNIGFPTKNLLLNRGFATFPTPAITDITKIRYAPDHGICYNPKRLNRNSESCNFFGVDSAKNIMSKLERQLSLTILKNKQHNTVNFPSFNIDNPDSINIAKRNIWKGKNSKIDQLFKQGTGRLTFVCDAFGGEGEKGTHTIGFVLNKKDNTLFILDSLPNSLPEIKKYQQTITDNLLNVDDGLHKINKIIISSKPQQNKSEFSCNNWTHANIEAVQNALRKGIEIHTEEQLNMILPDNINTILSEQQKYVQENLNGRSLFDIVL